MVERDLIGHDSERAAIIYQHEARGADLAITAAIDAYIEAVTPTGDGTPESNSHYQLGKSVALPGCHLVIPRPAGFRSSNRERP
jgi:hypothetical protein